MPNDTIATLLRLGANTLFHRRRMFAATIGVVRNAGGRVHEIDCLTYEAFRLDMTRALRFAENFGYEPWGGNLDALNDAFREVDFVDASGVAFAFTRFDALYASAERVAIAVIDILEGASRDHLVDGHRLIGLIQSDDPHIELPPGGARTPLWNHSEAMLAHRLEGEQS